MVAEPDSRQNRLKWLTVLMCLWSPFLSTLLLFSPLLPFSLICFSPFLSLLAFPLSLFFFFYFLSLMSSLSISFLFSLFFTFHPSFFPFSNIILSFLSFSFLFIFFHLFFHSPLLSSSFLSQTFNEINPTSSPPSFSVKAWPRAYFCNTFEQATVFSF